ncbi:MAG TPA: hypothetical protein VNI52_07925 [Sphingobacteriaceae bacterium]|nr:hypothetical protein [Sphingobacteriaceae bacterium]
MALTKLGYNSGMFYNRVYVYKSPKKEKKVGRLIRRPGIWGTTHNGSLLSEGRNL